MRKLQDNLATMIYSIKMNLFWKRCLQNRFIFIPTTPISLIIQSIKWIFFTEEEKLKTRKMQFPIDLENAFKLGEK